MRKSTRLRRLIAVRIVAGICAIAATNALAETIVLDCKPYKDANVCPSHWVINGDTKTVTWHWCTSPDTTEKRNVEITKDKITFDEDFMKRHYEFDRKTGRMWITAEGLSGKRFKDPDESICTAPKK
jgi:hypothetical protein